MTASEKEVKIIETIARKTWPNTFGEVMPKEQIDYMLDLIYNEKALLEQITKGHNFILINYYNQPVGYTSYELNYRNKPQLMIHKIYLLPSSQGLGIGEKTFNHFTQIAVEHQQKVLTLKVFHKNDKAIGFYGKKGFKKVDVETTDIGNGYFILDNVLEKELGEK